MTRFSSSLAIAVSLLALTGVGYVLTKDPAIPHKSVERSELDALLTRLDDLEDRLARLAARRDEASALAGGPAAPTAEDRPATELPDFSTAGDAQPPTDEGALLARLEAIETRVRGLEEDPVARAYSFLRSESAELRRRGIHQLRELARSDPEARAALREMLADPDAKVRSTALISLGDIKDQEAVPLVVDLLGDDDIDVRRNALHALTRLDAKDAAADIASFIDDEDGKMRWLAIDAMGKLGHKEAAGALVSALHDDDANIRGQAAMSLGEIGATEALPQLREFYKSASTEGIGTQRRDRYQAAYAMKRLGDPAAARAEVIRLGDIVFTSKDDRARGGALHGVAWLGSDDPVGREILQKAAQDPNEWIRKTAKKALEPKNDRDE